MNILLDEKPVDAQGLNTYGDLALKMNLKDPNQALAVMVNGKMMDLSTPIQEGANVHFLSFEEREGQALFWHSSAHVLAQAVLRLFPEAQPTIGPAIDQGFFYDFGNLQITEEDLKRIEDEAIKIVQENYAPERIVIEGKKQAKEMFKNNPFKVAIIEDLDDDGVFTAYKQGEFVDLCRGPHLPKLGKIKAFKVLKTSGAYWRGDAKGPMLTRLYGISFPDKKELKAYLDRIEEAKKRDHKILGPKLDIFSLKEEAPGMPFIHAKGMLMWNALIDFWRSLHKEHDYVEIKTPQIMSQSLWETSGHWFHYRDNMYHFTIEDRNYAIKPMNCPGCMLYFKSASHSYRELPLRISELGHVHRHEASGALSGLFRVRSFHQDDAHLFMKPTEIKDEILGVLKLVDTLYKTFNITYRLELSTRPEQSIGTDEDWQAATEGLKGALDAWGQPYRVNEGDGAFYGPKIDIHILDALSRSWQCGTVQLDMALPEKFGLEYTDQDGKIKRPVMVHRAIFGSIERFLGILIEHFAGRFPLWISPRQVRVLPIADRHQEFAVQVKEMLKSKGIHVEIDLAAESLNKKIRNAQIDQVNYMITIGDKELEEGKISVRHREGMQQNQIDLAFFLEKIQEEIKDKSLKSYLESV
jgi:threonyl-tRNA synthetase